MKEEKLFSVAEYYDGHLEEFQNFKTSKQGYEITLEYIEIMESALQEAGRSVDVEEELLPNGDFLIKLTSEEGIYEFEGFNNNNLTH